MNTSITPTDNFGGGKVKFFTGGSGVNDYYLTPLFFGCNQLDLSGELTYYLTINRNTYLGNNAVNYVNARSFLRGNNQIFFQSFYATIQCTEFGLGAQIITLNVVILVDDTEIYRIPYTLDSGNSWTQEIAFDVEEQGDALNSYPVNRYYAVKLEFSGDADAGYPYVLYNSSNNFTSLIDENNEYRSVLSSSFIKNSINITGNNYYYLSFGGCNYVANGSPTQNFTANFDCGIDGIYFMINELSSTILDITETISCELLIDGVVVDTLIATDETFIPYQAFILDTEIAVGRGQRIVLKLSGNNVLGNFKFAEIGCTFKYIP